MTRPSPASLGCQMLASEITKASLTPGQGLKNSSIGQKLDFANHPYLCKGLYFYNYKRIHLTIGYMTPAQKMAELKKVA
jgi:hypothetical protein